jgi:hypothetical protein
MRSQLASLDRLECRTLQALVVVDSLGDGAVIAGRRDLAWAVSEHSLKDHHPQIGKSSERLRRGMCFEVFRGLCAWKEPAADHLNAEQIGAVGNRNWYRDGTEHAGRHRRALAYAAEALRVRGHESHRELRQRT